MSRSTHHPMRMAVSSFVLGLAVAFVSIAPVSAAFTPTKAAIKKIATGIAKKQVNALAPGIAEGRVNALAPGIAEGRVNALAPAIADARVNALAPGIAEQVAERFASRVAVAKLIDFDTPVPVGASDLMSVNITAPAPGYLVVAGGLDLYGGPDDLLGCLIYHNSVFLAGSERVIELGAGNTEENCHIETAVTVGAGNHAIVYRISDAAANIVHGNGSLVVTWHPLGPTGVAPTASATAREASPGSRVARTP